MALNSARSPRIPLKMKGHRFWCSGQDSAACPSEEGLQTAPEMRDIFIRALNRHECFRNLEHLKETQVGPDQAVFSAEPDVALQEIHPLSMPLTPHSQILPRTLKLRGLPNVLSLVPGGEDRDLTEVALPGA